MRALTNRSRRTMWTIAIAATVFWSPFCLSAQTTDDSAQVFRAKVRVARQYFLQLQGNTLASLVSGPSFGTVKTTAPFQRSITELAALLKKCRGAGFAVGGSPNFPGKTVGFKNFECLEQGAIFPIVQASAVLSDDGLKVEKLELEAASAMRWTSPPPMPPLSEVGYDRAKLVDYQEQSRSLIAALTGPERLGPALSKLTFTSWMHDAGEVATVSSARLSHMLAGCTVAAVGTSSLASFDKRPKRHATRMTLKCDQRSSSREDVIAFPTFSKGKIDAMHVIAVDGYRFPIEAGVN